ncbi:hypothetical protein ACIQUC_09190 [Curtobacterium sp. NPDC098951]|uniref:hypothetical protein n=1 Tax=Curtobacterium sp. NPDC098951 TaxID=3363974 RepID=UPI00380F974B
MRRRWVVLGGIAAVALVAAVTVTAVSVTHAQDVARRLPPASASSEQVLRVYLRAATAHDCGLTEALSDGGSDPTAWCGGRTPSSWFDDHPDLLGYRHIGAVSRLSARETGRSAEECIPVDITETNMNGADPGVLTGWQFCFRHTPQGWRLTDEGYG